MTKEKLKISYKTVLYSIDKKALQESLKEIQKIKKVNYIRLKPAFKEHVIRKGPCGRGYAVYIKKKLKIYKWVIFLNNMTQLKLISNSITTPNVYLESSLC